MKDILRYTIWTGICLVLVVPFIVAQSMFFPYITGKAFLFRFIIEIIFLAWLILSLKYKEFRIKWSSILVSAILFIFVLLIADINAVAPYKAFWGNYERMEGFITFAHLLGYLLVLSSMLNTEKKWLWFFRANVIAGLIMAITSINEGLKDNVVRIAGPLGNPIYIAVYFLFIFFFALILLYKDVLFERLSSWKIFTKIFSNILLYLYLVVAALSLFVVYRTSRGALLGLAGGVLVAAFFVFIFERSKKTANTNHLDGGKKVIRQIALGGIIMVIAVATIFISIKNTQFVKNNPTLSRLAEISWSNVNGQARQLIWPMAIKGFKEKPILGWGQEGFNYVFNKYYNPAMYGQESWFDRAHNAPLDFLVAGGILGLLTYLSLFGSAIYLLWFRKNSMDITERGLLTGLLAGYLFQAIFVFDNLISYILFFTTLAYIHSGSVNDNKNVNQSSEPTRQNKNHLLSFVQNEEYQNYILIPTMVILITFSAYWINIPSLQANKTLIQAFRLIQSRNTKQGLETFKEALTFESMGDSEIREQLLAYTSSILKIKEVDPEIKQEFFHFTISELKKQIERVPNDARYYILLGSFLNNTGNSEQAIDSIKKAIELSPLKQAMRFELVQALYNLGKSTEALQEAKSAYELDKRFEQAKLIYIKTIENEIKLNPKFKIEGEKLLNDLNID